MTIDDAIAILNAREHRSETRWRKEGDDPVYDRVVGSHGSTLSFFEAIAVAEKYEREAKEAIPAASPETAAMVADEPTDAIRKASRSLWEKLQHRLGKNVWSIGVGGNKIYVFGSAMGLRGIADTWEGFHVVKRDCTQPFVGERPVGRSRRP